MKGLDYAWTRPPASAIKAAGFGFAARYLSHDASKNLSPGEAKALLADGIEIVVVWEYGARDMLRGHAGGVADAQAADAQARACGLGEIPLYFAADWDAAPGDQPEIDAYLDGCASVIGPGRVGGYGGFWPLLRARAHGKLAYTWGTLAWSGGNWDPQVNPHTFTPDIMQGAQVRIAGISVDLDESHGRVHDARPGDFGQFPPPPLPKRKRNADGATSLREWAHRPPRPVQVQDVIHAMALAKPHGFGPMQAAYITQGDWDLPMPEGMDLPA
jgi:hypothetical protein